MHPPISIELPAQELETSEHGNLSYQGIPTFAYIRQGGSEPRKRRVHFTYCSIIKKHPAGKFFCTNRNDGEFEAYKEVGGNLPANDKGNPAKPQTYNLKPCLPCIAKYLGIPEKEEYPRRKIIADNFDYKQFIYEMETSLHSSAWRSRLFKFTDKSWSELSEEVRRLGGWSCEECGLVLGEEYRMFLHVHHINQDRSFNHRVNLISLCLDCHSLQPNHKSLGVGLLYDEFCKNRSEGRFGQT